MSRITYCNDPFSSLEGLMSVTLLVSSFISLKQSKEDLMYENVLIKFKQNNLISNRFFQMHSIQVSTSCTYLYTMHLKKKLSDS